MKHVGRLLLIGLMLLGGDLLCGSPDTISQSHSLFADQQAFTRSDVMFPGNEVLVEKTVNWTCRTAGELTPPQLNVTYYLGAEIHYGHPWSIRNKPWKRMPDGRDNTRNVNLRISLVPYIESEQGQRYYLVPSPTSATFYRYALACASSDEQTLMRAYPDLYPSLGLKACTAPTGKN